MQFRNQTEQNSKTEPQFSDKISAKAKNQAPCHCHNFSKCHANNIFFLDVFNDSQSSVVVPFCALAIELNLPHRG